MNKTFTVSACVTVWLTVISGSLKWGRVGTDFTASGKPSQCVCVYSIYGSCAEARGQTALQCVMCPKRLRTHICACDDNDFVHADEPECHRFLERHVRSERGHSGAVLWLLFFNYYSNKRKKRVQERKQRRSHIYFCMKAILVAWFCNGNISKKQSQSPLTSDQLPSCAGPHVFRGGSQKQGLPNEA